MSRTQASLFDPGGEFPTETLEQLNAEMFQRARSLPGFESSVLIPGVGKLRARVAVVGESPGPPDIQPGTPFTGPAGEMLDRILGSIGLSRTDCYLTNTVKFVCTGDEITPDLLAFFGPYLHRELRVVQPHAILSLGNTATRTLLRTKRPISQLRGEFHDYYGTPLMPTFNPAYLLRDPSKKRETWEDIKKLRAILTAQGG
jgi:uracil-DNA glycosylase family 4